MPYGPGTYGDKVGRPPEKGKPNKIVQVLASRNTNKPMNKGSRNV